MKKYTIGSQSDREHAAYSVLRDSRDTLELVHKAIKDLEAAMDRSYVLAMQVAARPRQNGGKVALDKLQHDVLPVLLQLKVAVAQTVEHVQDIATIPCEVYCDGEVQR